MIQSIEEQIASKCIHFNGMFNDHCDLGISYDSVKIKTERPYKIPCIKNVIFHGGHCDHCKFPSKEAVKARVAEIDEMEKKSIGNYMAIKEHYRATKQPQGQIECVACGGKLQYRIAQVNGHIWAKCIDCDSGFIE